MKCEYYEACPCKTGWCLNNDYDESCVFHLQQAVKILKEENLKLSRDKEALWNSYKYR